MSYGAFDDSTGSEKFGGLALLRQDVHLAMYGMRCKSQSFCGSSSFSRVCQRNAKLRVLRLVGAFGTQHRTYPQSAIYVQKRRCW